MKLPYCLTCNRRGMAHVVLPEYRTTRWHDGREIAVVVRDLPAFQCPDCGAVRLPQESETRIEVALMKHLNLPLPVEVRGFRDQARFSPADLALLIGIQAEQVESWEEGRTYPSREAADRFHKVRELWGRSRSTSPVAADQNPGPASGHLPIVPSAPSS
jgi:DNA-binding transcriptional regulator YiaG